MDEINFGLNVFCGPAVLSIFTGLDTDTCAAAVSEINKKHNVTGVMPSDLMKAGNNLGLKFTENEAFQGRSLFWTASALINFEGQYLVTIPRHYIAIEVKNKKISICDNHTKQPIDLQNSARLAQKVEKVWRVDKVKEYIVPKFERYQIDLLRGLGRIAIVKYDWYSDGNMKSYSLGTIDEPIDKKLLQEVAFKLMEISEK